MGGFISSEIMDGLINVQLMDGLEFSTNFGLVNRLIRVLRISHKLINMKLETITSF